MPARPGDIPFLLQGAYRPTFPPILQSLVPLAGVSHFASQLRWSEERTPCSFTPTLARFDALQACRGYFTDAKMGSVDRIDEPGLRLGSESRIGPAGPRGVLPGLP